VVHRRAAEGAERKERPGDTRVALRCTLAYE
jgi:hypothetical protein